MDFIERLFGVSPDGGSGAFEFSILLSVVAIASAVVFRRTLRRWFFKVQAESRLH